MVEHATDRARVESVTDREVGAVTAGDIAAYLALLDDGAIFLPPNLLPKQGAELHEWLRGFLNDFSIQYFEFSHDETEISGDMAYHRFTYGWSVKAKKGGEAVIAHGKGFHILRRAPDGDWKIFREIWNANPRHD